MKKLNKIYEHISYCMIRTPIFSKNYKTNYTLPEINNINKSIFTEAILIASNSLYKDSNKIIPEQKSESLKLIISKEKYRNRMSVRSTPFGIFSGVNIVKFSDKTTLELDSPKYFKKNSSINIEWLLDFIYEIENDICIKYPKTNLIANNLIYFINNKIYLTESIKFPNKTISVNATELLIYILEITKEQLPVYKIVNKISHKFKINDEIRIIKYLQELLDKEFLISCLRIPLVNIDNYFKTIIKKLEYINFDQNILQKLYLVNNQIIAYNNQFIGTGINNILEISKILQEIKKSNTQPLKVDMNIIFKGDEPTININVGKTIAKAADIIWYLSRRYVGLEHLKEYKTNFIEKYGLNQLVKLQELVNDTIGLGYPKKYKNIEPKINNTNENLTNNIYLKFIQSIKNNSFIQLTDDDVYSIATEKNTLFAPQSLEIYSEIIAKSQADIDSNNFYIALNHMNSSLSFGKSFGRFYNNFHENYQKKIDSDIKKISSNRSDIEYIELSELPTNKKLANVMNIYSPFNFYLNLGINGNISLDDIYVGCNIEYMYFFSKKLNKRLIFTSTSMINTSILSNLYRFLTDVSLEETKLTDIISFPEIDNFPFTPRILYKNIILRPAKWIISTDILELDDNMKIDIFKKKFYNYQEKIGIPNEFWLVFSDNKILLDVTNNDIHTIILYKEFIKHKKLVLTENIYGQFKESKHEFSSIKGNDGYYFSEIVVPVRKTSVISDNINIPQNIHDYKFHINEINDWMYFEITIPKNKQNKFIGYNIKNFIISIEKYLIKWFFIRYMIDNNHVIRIRFNIKNDSIAIIYNLFIGWYKQLYINGIISYYKLLPYERETFRYGGELIIDEMEKFFQSESLFTINLLNLIQNNDNETEKDILVSIFLYKILCSFKVDLNKLLYISEKDFNIREIIHKNSKFIADLVKNNFFNFWAKNNQYYVIIKDYLVASEQLNLCLNKNIVNLTNSKESIVMSIIHMQCNRIYGVDRKKESMILALFTEIYKIRKYI